MTSGGGCFQISCLVYVWSFPNYASRQCSFYLLECLLILSVLEGVDEGVDGGGHPGEDRGDDVEGGHVDLVINHIDQHQREEADEEADEDGQHHLGQSEVLLPLG